MWIEIGKLSPEGSFFEGFEPAELLKAEGDTHLQACSDVKYELFAQLVSRELLVKGVISVDLKVECSRCASFFSTTVADSSFLRAYELLGDTERVDVAEDIREGILLLIPRFALCSDQCKGLCPQCGKNLEKDPCDCQPPQFDDTWQALDGIKLK